MAREAKVFWRLLAALPHLNSPPQGWIWVPFQGRSNSLQPELWCKVVLRILVKTTEEGKVLAGSCEIPQYTAFPESLPARTCAPSHYDSESLSHICQNEVFLWNSVTSVPWTSLSPTPLWLASCLALCFPLSLKQEGKIQVSNHISGLPMTAFSKYLGLNIREPCELSFRISGLGPFSNLKHQKRTSYVSYMLSARVLKITQI